MNYLVVDLIDRQTVQKGFFIIKTLLVLVLYFFLQATDGLHTTLCDVNITIRDVNNHAPQFLQNNYMASIAENTEVGKIRFGVQGNTTKFY